MHYKNNREAKNGDKVIMIPSFGAPVAGLLYNAVAGNDSCNGRIAICRSDDPYPNLAECLHADDIAAVSAVNGIPDSTVTQNVGNIASVTATCCGGAK